jgi:hypothetical protein
MEVEIRRNLNAEIEKYFAYCINQRQPVRWVLNDDHGSKLGFGLSDIASAPQGVLRTLRNCCIYFSRRVSLRKGHRYKYQDIPES